MKVLFVASEALPFMASGGLGDVAGSLPAALRKRLIGCRVVMPLYDSIPQELKDQMQFITSISVPVAWRRQYCGIFEAKHNGVIYYLLDNQYYFKRDGIYGHYDDAERFAFFARAVLEIIPAIDWKPDIIHCNDWQSALTPLYYSCYYANRMGYENIKTVFTIHNIQYQGKYGDELLEDVLGIAELAEKVYKAWKECTPNPKRGVTITVSTACFVPKPHTAFQWEAQVSMEEYRRRVKLLRDNMRGRSIRYNWHDPDTSFLEAVFSRGDRRVADVIEEAWRQGAKFDAWSEYFDFDRWMAAFDACGLDPAFYANRVREKDEVLPWSVTSTGVTTPFLWRERERAYQAVITPDCRVQCTGCGADKLYPGGKCDAEA